MPITIYCYFSVIGAIYVPSAPFPFLTVYLIAHTPLIFFSILDTGESSSRPDFIFPDYPPGMTQDTQKHVNKCHFN